MNGLGSTLMYKLYNGAMAHKYGISERNHLSAKDIEKYWDSLLPDEQAQYAELEQTTAKPSRARPRM